MTRDLDLSPPKRVLTIQSHVVNGYVGNRASTFPLQVLGWDVDVVNTVQYSNHAGYQRFGGVKTQPKDLVAIFEGLKNNSLLGHDRLLTGFVPDPESLGEVATVAQNMRSQNPDLIYLLDPVLGDDGKLYVSPDNLPIYRDRLFPIATIITPNWFEAELLTGVSITSVTTLRVALRILHEEHHIPNVVISSLKIHDSFIASLPADIRPDGQPEDEMYSSKSLLCLCSASSPSPVSGEPSLAPQSVVHALTVPSIKGYFSGVGDIFSALVLAHFPSSSTPAATSTASPITHPLAYATSRALSTTHTLIYATRAYALTLGTTEHPDTDTEADDKDPERRVKRMRARELRIIQGVDAIKSCGYHRDMVLWDGFWKEGREDM
ncbi:hypothetical protein BOTBODRAFT_102651 [Botryobasidium botryosum FD-172 SS1]|uniref:pyridoxal kinase n=1 Tax=Botryobasidium botryosum (strain FD-172 SS1) TaxID=930990 RepID=A0A067MV51_BOTB1|nr:hypothetical protein BOTBODRAFT_102651 [Botryobasidium botryosum FD-172 SS1]